MTFFDKQTVRILRKALMCTSRISNSANAAVAIRILRVATRFYSCEKSSKNVAQLAKVPKSRLAKPPLTIRLLLVWQTALETFVLVVFGKFAF